MAEHNRLSFSETIELLKCIHPEHHIPVLVGPPGIAKSACAKQFCKEMGITPERQAFLSIALNDTGDIVGFPYKVQNADGSDSGRMGFAVPPWWLGQYDPDTGERRPLSELQEPYDDGLKYCLVIDEANRDADPQKQAAMINLFLERNIQGRWLPKQTYVILSINEGEHYLVEDFDPAVKNRIMPISFRPKISEWRSWFRKSEDHNSFVDGFLDTEPGKRCFWPGNFDSEIASGRQFPSPRSLAKVAALLNGFGVRGETEILQVPKSKWRVMQVAIVGLLGDRGAKAFKTYLEAEKARIRRKHPKTLPADIQKIDELLRMAQSDLRTRLSTQSPSDANDTMSAFISYMDSSEFSGWTSMLENLAQSIVHHSAVPNENKLNFMKSCKAQEHTDSFELIIKNLEPDGDSLNLDFLD